jgi:hypothetical protein
MQTNNNQWILGNTFPFVVFTSFGAFWLGYGATLQPFYNSYEAYRNPAVQSSTGIESVGFNVGIGKCSHLVHIDSNDQRADNHDSILHDRHGHTLPDLPHLLCPYQPDLLPHLLHARSRLWPPRWRLPQCCQGQRWCRCKVSRSGWRFCLCHMHAWMVYPTCYHVG